ncbi:MAG: phosphatidylserine decarboxylase [Fibrobacteres bacterium]|nr:phosphatidylserine decarboxylase [Fibrobacterota bacterium]
MLVGATPSRFKSARPQFSFPGPSLSIPTLLIPGATLFYRLLYILPKNLLSHLVGILTHCRYPFGLHTVLKNWFIKQYRIETEEAEFPLEKYPTMGDFFVRKLKPGSRPIAQTALVSPVDGTLTQGGGFQPGNAVLTQIKGLEYNLHDLAGPGWNLEEYLQGGFLTIYLAPYNYHRIHAPIDGQVTRVSYVPGALWPVNTWSVSHIPGLFVVNERITVELSGPEGKALVVMVGATNVGRITLDFHSGMEGNRVPRDQAGHWQPPSPINLAKGQGLGCFELGSTVILVLSKTLMEKVDQGLLVAGAKIVRMGQGLSP